MTTREGDEMPLRDRLYMSSIDKFIHYGRFPWALTTALLLALCTTFQVLLVVSSSTNYSYYQMQLWNDIFLNRDIQGEDSVIINSYHLFNLVKLQSFVSETVDRYMHINKYTIDKYEHYDLHNNKPIVRMYIDYLDRDEASVIPKQSRGLETHYLLTETNLGPFSHYNPKKFVEIINSFVLQFSFKHKLNHNIPTSSSCYTWTLYQTYSYSMHGPMTVSLSFDRSVCEQDICNQYLDTVGVKYYGLNFIVLALAITQIALTISQLYRRTALMSSVQNVRATTATGIWDSLDFEDKMKFIDLWVIFTSIGNICQILGCLSVLIVGSFALSVNEVMIGLGCFFSWISVIQHLKQYHTTYIVIDTLSRSFYRLGPYICGVPIFMGFVFLGMCLFWKTGNYSTLTDAMIISYTMVNGDTLYPNMSLNTQVAGVFGEIYCYAFLLFFISVVQNIFIAIIVDGFQSLKHTPIDKTGNEEVDEYKPSVNISLQTMKSLKEEKTLARID